MSSALSRSRGEKSTESTDEERGPMMRVLRTAMEDADRSGDRGMARTYLLVDLGAVVGNVLGRRGTSVGDSEPLAEIAPEPETTGQKQGRSTLSRLFLLGAIVGIGYMMRKRSGSMNEVVDKATERAREVADQTAMRSGEIAGRTETASQQAAEQIQETGESAAERIQEGSEKAAERVEEGGEQAADQMEGAGETVENVEQTAEEKTEEMTDSGEDSEESEE